MNSGKVQTISVLQLETSASYQLSDTPDGGVGHQHWEGLQRLWFRDSQLLLGDGETGSEQHWFWCFGSSLKEAQGFPQHLRQVNSALIVNSAQQQSYIRPVPSVELPRAFCPKNGDWKPAALLWTLSLLSPLFTESLDPCSAHSGPEMKDYGVESSWISHHRESPTTHSFFFIPLPWCLLPQDHCLHTGMASWGLARWALSKSMT